MTDLKELLYTSKRDSISRLPELHPEWVDETLMEYDRIMELFKETPLVDDYDTSILEDGLIAYQNMCMYRSKLSQVRIEDNEELYNKYYRWFCNWQGKYRQMLHDLMIPTAQRIQWLRKFSDIASMNNKTESKFAKFQRESINRDLGSRR